MTWEPWSGGYKHQLGEAWRDVVGWGGWGVQGYIRGRGGGWLGSGWEVISNWTGKLEKPQGLVAELRLQKGIHPCPGIAWIAKK